MGLQSSRKEKQCYSDQPSVVLTRVTNFGDVRDLREVVFVDANRGVLTVLGRYSSKTSVLCGNDGG